MQTTRIFLLRHGRTRLNSAEVVRGLLDSPLDQTGCRQAAALGGFLQAVGITRVVTSPLQRARQSAEIIAKGDAIIIERGLRDRDYGPWTGWPTCEVSERFGRVDNAPGIESTAAFMHRVAAALSSVVHTYRGESLAVVGHTAVNRAVFGWFFPGWKGIVPRVAQDTGCWNLIEVHEDQWELLAVNRQPTEAWLPLRRSSEKRNDWLDVPLAALEPTRRIVARHPSSNP